MQRSLLKFIISICCFLISAPVSQALTCKSILSSTSQKSYHRSIQLSEQNLDMMLEFEMVTKKEYKHFKEDLLKGQEEINSKSSQEGYQTVLDKWENFLVQIEPKVQEYKKMSREDQKKWKKQMRTLLFFSVGHFVTALESSDSKILRKSHTMLNAMSSIPKDADLRIYLFEMEKEVMKYFSIDEFNRCKF